MAEFRSQGMVPAQHPSLPGHFPGHPIVPGVLLLEYVLEATRTWRGPASRLAGLPAVKFLGVLQPAEPFDIHLEDEGPRIRFTCSAGARVLAQGTLTLVTHPA